MQFNWYASKTSGLSAPRDRDVTNNNRNGTADSFSTEIKHKSPRLGL